MKIINIYLALILAVSTIYGCKDVLDKRDLETIDENIWNDEVQATLFLNGLYSKTMPSVADAMGEFSGFTEETYSGSSTITDYLYGVITEREPTTVIEMSIANYNLIRQINICIEGVEGGTLPDSIARIITGQAYFLRAYRHFRMLKFYGGIPIINSVLDPFHDDLDIPRYTTKESVDMIVEDLDYAINQLPIDYKFVNDNGRITKGGAAAFKGRVLLFWASPQFNPDNKLERWERAYNANVQAKTIASQMAIPRALNPSFDKVFTDDVASNPEAIFFRTYNGTDAFKNGWEGRIRSYSGGGGSGQKPTWELVKAFPMANGKMTADPSSGFDSIMYWQNRDPRFYSTIAFTGSLWPMTGRVTEVGNFETDYVATYGRPNNIELVRSPNNPGFLARKASDSNIHKDLVSATSTCWHEIRYAEVLLNLAECANEIGETGVMLENLRLVRARAGIEEGFDGNYGYTSTTDKVLMREQIMNERLAEFAYEGKRYWDLRRRLMYRNDLGSFTKKLNGTKRHTIRLSPKSPYNGTIRQGIYSGLGRIDTVIMLGHFDLNSKEDYQTYFNVTMVDLDSPTASSDGIIAYRELYDFFNIPKAIIERSPAVEQTLGWLNGTFDPLAE